MAIRFGDSNQYVYPDLPISKRVYPYSGLIGENTSSVSFAEKIPGSPVYSFSNGQTRCERTFLFKWADRDRFVKAMLGFPRIVNTDGTITLQVDTSTGQATTVSSTTETYISRSLPDFIEDIVDPTHTNKPWLWATQVTNMRGIAEDGTYDDDSTEDKTASYLLGQATVMYESLTYNILEDDEILGDDTGRPDESDKLPRFVTRVQKPSAEFIQLNRGTMKWVDNANKQPVDYATAVIIPSTEITYTWHQVPFVPDAAAGATSYVGCVNGDTFQDSTDIYLPGTLLLMAAEIRPYRLGSGVFVQDIVYRMKYFEPEPGRGHNFLLRYYPNQHRYFRTKITDNGSNDSVKIISDFDSTLNGPYATQQDFMRAGSDPTTAGRPLYQYKAFRNLFLFHPKYDPQ